MYSLLKSENSTYCGEKSTEGNYAIFKSNKNYWMMEILSQMQFKQKK